MAEFTDKCEHCGHLNLRGTLHCDSCGGAIAANMDAMYRAMTRKAKNLLPCGVVSALLAAAMLNDEYETMRLLDFMPEVAVAFLVFLLCATTMYCLFYSLKNFFERSRYRIKAVPPGGSKESGAASDAQIAKSEEEAAPRMSDAELVKSMAYYKKRSVYFLIAVLPSFFAGVFAMKITDQEFSVYSVIGIVLFIIAFVFFYHFMKNWGKAKAMFKVNVVSGALKSIIDDCVYRPGQSVSRERVEAAGLIGGWNKFGGEDYISGTYKGHKIEFSDIHLEHEYTDSDDDKHSDTIFRGHWLTVELSKHLPAIIRLAEGGDKGDGNVETENMAFNNKYKIYTDDPHYMFYVLTPHFMEYMIAADKAAKARTYFYFAGDKVHIAVDNSRDMFELGSDADKPDMARERIKNEMKYVTDILDELLLNDSLF